MAAGKTARQIEAETGGAIDESTAARYLLPNYLPSRLEANNLRAVQAYNVNFTSSHETKPAAQGAGFSLAATLAGIDASGLPEWEKRAAREQALATHRQLLLETEAQSARDRSAAEKERARAIAIEAETALARTKAMVPGATVDSDRALIADLPSDGPDVEGGQRAS